MYVYIYLRKTEKSLMHFEDTFSTCPNICADKREGKTAHATHYLVPIIILIYIKQIFQTFLLAIINSSIKIVLGLFTMISEI